MASLSRAVELTPSSARYAYVYGVALNSAGAGDRALGILKTGHARHPGDPDILVARSVEIDRRIPSFFIRE